MAADLRFRESSVGGRTTTEVISGTVNGATYIWQPWFMQVLGSVGLVAGVEQASETGSTNNLGGIGSLNISIFPVSRFPFNFYADVNDTRASGQVTDIDYRSYRLRLSQSYVPQFANERYYGSYEYNELKTIDSGLSTSASGRTAGATDALQLLRFGAMRGWQQQSLEGDVSVSRNRREEGDAVQETRLDFANLYHTFRPGSTFAMDSVLSFTRTVVDAPKPLTLNIVLPGTHTESDFTQLVSFASYRPNPVASSPSAWNNLTATATFRAFEFGNEVDNVGTQSKGATGQVALAYSLSPRTQVYSTTQVGVFSGNVVDASSVAAETLGVTYTAEPIPLGSFLYSWLANTSATVGSVSGGPNDGVNYLGQATLSHSLNRPYSLGSAGSLVLTGSQSISYASDSMADSQGILTTTLASFWNSPQASGTQAFAGFTFSDARRFGAFGGFYQLANVQANLSISTSRWSALSAGLSFQASRFQDDRPDLDRPFDPYLSAIEGQWRNSYALQGTYTHARAFGVRQLLYTALVQASSTDYDSRALGNPDGSLYKVDWLVENRLEYQIGRLTLLGVVRWAELQNRGSSFSAFVRAQRTFGQF